MENVLLSVAECYRADQLAEQAGVPSLDLMEAAGAGIARAIMQRWKPVPVSILCGPGNNGGDGFVVARYLAEAGWPVRVVLLGDSKKLKGDAAENAKRWTGSVEPVNQDVLDDCQLVVDGLFGAGLTRPIDGEVKNVIEAINDRGLDCVGIDVPSGVHGDTGSIMGAAPNCALTVTFFCPKPGLFLLPGRLQVGELEIIDIGIPQSVLDDIQPQTFVNDPSTWRGQFPQHRLTDNKYTRGHAVISGGPEMTGAARLAARGARHIGAGLVTICATPEAFPIYAAGEPGNIVKPIENEAEFTEFLSDPRRNAILVGPGAGVSKETRDRVMTALNAGKATVLDADALTVFEDEPEDLFGAIVSPCVLTPHEGEFKRIFPDLTGSKLERARAAAQHSGAYILLKGGDSVIAAPDGRAAINNNASAELATAGSGDVLAGMVVGLLAQGMEPFEASCAATWIHGEAGIMIGPGLIAENLPEVIPTILQSMQNQNEI